MKWELQSERVTQDALGDWVPVDFNNCFIFSSPHKFAKKCVDDEGIKITACYRYNGSGSRHFGGAKKWPVVKLQVGFEVGQEKKRDRFIEELKRFLETAKNL